MTETQPKPTVYVETTIPSYVTSWPRLDLIIAAHQQITRIWWPQRTGSLRDGGREKADEFTLRTAPSAPSAWGAPHASVSAGLGAGAGTTMTDPIVEEVRSVRAKIAEECGYDLRRILEHAQQTAAQIPGLRYVTKKELAARKRHAAEPSPPATPTSP